MAFYLPQLVQQLRADPGGLVEAFLLDGAAKSQLFAHHLICTLRVRSTASVANFNALSQCVDGQVKRERSS